MPPTHLLRAAAAPADAPADAPAPAARKHPPTLYLDSTPLPKLSPSVLHARTLASNGLRLYDPGFAHTLSCTSSLTLINGAAGVLRHRGHPIEALAARAEFLELAYLLFYAALPSARQLARFRAALYHPRHAAIHADAQAVVRAFSPAAHPMPMLQAALAAVGAAHPPLSPAHAGVAVYAAAPPRERALLMGLAQMPALAAGIFRHRAGRVPAFLPQPAADDALARHDSFAARFLRLAVGPDTSRTLHPALVRALDVLLVLHADHEQNCSTATVRQLSSSGVDVFSALAGGVAALYGPLHGGANEAVLRMLARIGSADGVPAFLERVKKRQEKLMGFGHRVYRNYDPRARIIRGMAYDVFDAVGSRDPLIDVATALEKAALGDDYFVSRKLFPNCDFYSGLIYKALGFDPDFFTVLFALGRCAGWMAHWKEFLDDPDRRIARPHQRYVGPVGPIEVDDLERRPDAPDGPSEAAGAPAGTVAKL